MFFIFHSQMEVKTGDLRNNLSRYLRRVRQTGDAVVVMDRDTPVAVIHPYPAAKKADSVWSARRQIENQLGPLDDEFELPERSTASRKHRNPLD